MVVRRCRCVSVPARSEQVPDTAGNAREFHMLPQRLTEDIFERLRSFVGCFSSAESDIGFSVCGLTLPASLRRTVSRQAWA